MPLSLVLPHHLHPHNHHPFHHHNLNFNPMIPSINYPINNSNTSSGFNLIIAFDHIIVY